jgi:[protein-PII] uridylyltransferase
VTVEAIIPARAAHPPVQMRAPRVDNVINGAQLRAQLTAAALDHSGDDQAATRAAVDHLHRALFRGRMIAQELLDNGLDGVSVARFLSDVQDEVLRALFDYTTVHVFRARNPTAGERLSLLAVGGYGRGTLAPSSDTDLLFLRSYKSTPWAESVIEFMLYRLWDLGIKVGHAVRTPEECVRLAREDHTIRTAMLDARPLLGDAELAARFETQFRTEAATFKLKDYVAAKLAERDGRHTRLGGSRYGVEPNVKESKGGLRDLDSLGWIANAIYGVRKLDELTTHGVFSTREAAIIRRAARFLWTVRCHLHYLTGRAEERLSFDLQPEIARRMGYDTRADQPGVERFMKRYFLAAREVGSMTRVFSAKLEAQSHKQPERLGWFLPKDTRALAQKGLRLRADRLDLMPGALDADPVAGVRLFTEMCLRDVDVHPDAMQDLAKRVRALAPGLRTSPAASAAFLELLTARKPNYLTLTRMNDAGLLGAILPEFGRIVGQTQFNMYHHYTVDEHSLLLLDTLNQIESGALAEALPLSSEVAPKLKHRRALYLAALLHDTGKGIGDQQVEGAAVARTACLRLGLDAAEAELVAWLVGNHLEMSDTAQRRDVSDPRTVAAFAQRVGSLENLRLLLLLTVADIRAVGPGVWNGWKAQLLRELYYATESVLRGGSMDERHVLRTLQVRAQEARSSFAAARPELAMALTPFPDAYWLATDEAARVWHAGALSSCSVEPGAPVGVTVASRIAPGDGALELLIAAPDRPGLFADLAAACSMEGADILNAAAHTRQDGVALDVFSLIDGGGGPFGISDPHRLARLVAGAERAAAGPQPKGKEAATPLRADRRQAAFLIEPTVTFDNDAAAEHTLIEVSGRNRPGLLRDLARTLAESGIDIRSAHVGTYGETACDVFYVREAGQGGKLGHSQRREDLAAALTAVLAADDPGAPRTPARSLARARASGNR